jgi:flagellar capping protein FliD
MIGLPNPWMILGAIAVCTGTYFYGHHKGWYQRDAEMQAEIAVKNEESRAREQKLAEQINQTSTELKAANDSITKKQSALDRAISAGRVRLPAASCVQASPSAPAPSGDSSQAGTQPDRPVDQPSDADRETLRLIAQIAADGDKAIVQLNACIDAYNQVRSQVNGQH